jgi:hypothetical protein
MKAILIAVGLCLAVALPAQGATKGILRGGGAPASTSGPNGQSCGWRAETSRNYPNLSAACQAVFKDVAADCANHVYQEGRGWSLRRARLEQVARQKGVMCRY